MAVGDYIEIGRALAIFTPIHLFVCFVMYRLGYEKGTKAEQRQPRNGADQRAVSETTPADRAVCTNNPPHGDLLTRAIK